MARMVGFSMGTQPVQGLLGGPLMLWSLDMTQIWVEYRYLINWYTIVVYNRDYVTIKINY
jgi:hypothetical protein